MGEPVVAGIVVHHRSYETVAATVRAILQGGLASADLLVVDNSEDPARRQQLQASLGGVEVLFTDNKGYGAPVNEGLARLREERKHIDFLLVATHEALPETQALRLLVEAGMTDPTVGAAGPTMLIGTGPDVRVWSCGGSRSRVLHAHTHVIPESAVAEIRQMEPADRLWLDGAFILYRAAALPDPPFDDRYFLYMEEADLHYRLRADGWTCRWVPSAVIKQATNLMPAYYFGRNVKLFFRKNEDPFRAAVVPSALALREVVRRLRVGDRRGAWDTVRGFLTPARRTHRPPATP